MSIPTNSRGEEGEKKGTNRVERGMKRALEEELRKGVAGRPRDGRGERKGEEEKREDVIKKEKKERAKRKMVGKEIE